MDFGTFYRMRQMRGSERTRDMMTNDDINQSENFSQLPVQSSVQSDFDHPPHPQFNYDRGFEEDDANIYGDYSTGTDFCNDPSWEERDYGDLHRRRGTRGRGRTRGGGREMGPSGGRDFGNDPSWEFPEERDLGDLDGTRNERGRGRARGGGREMGPSGGRGRGSGPGRGWPSDSWADHVNPSRPWHNEGGDGWGAERRDIVEQRDSQNNSVDWNELEHEAELARPTTPDCPQYPSDSGIERYMTQRASSDVSVPAAAKGKEEQTLIHQKLERGDEKTDDHAGKNKSSQETSDQKSNNIPEDAVLVAWAEGITQDKSLEKDIVDDTEDMAITQSQDPKRTAFNCSYCGVSSNSIYDFKDHVKGNLHKENFASLIEGKRRREQQTPMTDIKRETLGKHSFLQMDLYSFRMDPVVGLSYITEIQSTFGIKCICHLCGTMFSHIGGQNHVTSLQHCMRYLREKSPESYEYACQFPTRSARSRAMHRILQDIERSDGRGTTVFYVFEDKPSSEGNSSSSPDEPDAVKFRQAFEESVNQELQIARQKIEDGDLFLDEEVEEDDPFSDRSAYVQLFDLEGERDSFFEENVTENADITCEDAGASHDSPKLRATDVSDPSSEVPALSSVNKGNKNEKEGEQKNDDLEGSDGDKKPKQAVDDKTKNEEKDKVELHSRVVFQWHELGKISFLKKTLQEVSTEPFIGLSYVTEYQHITDIQCICRLCGVTFGYYSGKTHLLGFKHRLRYLRQMWPLAYAEFTKLKTKREVNPKLHPIVKTIEKKDGPGTPQIRVYGCKDGSKKEGNNSNSVSDNQNQDSCDGTDMSQAEIDKQHSEFMSFVHQEHQHAKVFVREPVVFEHGYKLENPPIDPRLNMPPHHDPMGVDPYLRQHPYHMRMRPDPYFNPNPFERPMRARPYPDKGPIPDPFIKMGRDEPYFDPDPTKRMRRDDPDPLIRERQHDADLLERRRGDVPYLDPDPLKRIRRGEPYYDPDPLKRRGHRESYLDPNPLKRLRFNEPYIDPDPLKRVLPSQKAVKKPVVIDYGHGSEKKSAKNTADQWEQDIKDILNDSKAPDSLAQLSCSYSSPKKEDTPPPSQPKRELPFSRSYIERSKALQEKSSSSKKERSQYSPDREESRGYKLGSSSRKYRRSRSPLSIKERSRAMLKDPVKRDRTDSSSRRYKYSKSPEVEDSSPRRYERIDSPEDFRSRQSLKHKDQTVIKKRNSRSPVKEKLISYAREKGRYISPPRKKSSEKLDLRTRDFIKSRSPERYGLKMKVRDKEDDYDMIQSSSRNPEVDREGAPLKVPVREKTYPNRPENFNYMQKGSRQPDSFIDLTSDEEVNLPTPSNVEKSSPKKNPKPDTSNDEDEAQADLIAEMLLTMKNSIIGQDADPRSALKAILSQDITKVLLATKKLEEKESTPKVQEERRDKKNRDSLERYKEETAGSSTSDRQYDLKSKVKKKTPPPPAREKIMFSFAGRSRGSGNLMSQSILQDSDEDDVDEDNN